LIYDAYKQFALAVAFVLDVPLALTTLVVLVVCAYGYPPVIVGALTQIPKLFPSIFVQAGVDGRVTFPIVPFAKGQNTFVAAAASAVHPAAEV